MDDLVSPPKSEGPLRANAREALQSGKVPPRKPDRTLRGLGTGKNCVVCGELITLTQMEIELEFKRQSPVPAVERYLAHPRCFSALELELRELYPASAPSSRRDRRSPGEGLAPIKL
jgi:hypothetical protein